MPITARTPFEYKLSVRSHYRRHKVEKALLVQCLYAYLVVIICIWMNMGGIRDVWVIYTWMGRIMDIYTLGWYQTSVSRELSFPPPGDLR